MADDRRHRDPLLRVSVAAVSAQQPPHQCRDDDQVGGGDVYDEPAGGVAVGVIHVV